MLTLDLYRDDVSGKIMNIPVMLNKHLYDLDTLLMILKLDKLDPITKKPFELTDIQPGKDIADEMENLIERFKQKYMSVSEKPVSVTESGQGMFAVAPKALPAQFAVAPKALPAQKVQSGLASKGPAI